MSVYLDDIKPLRLTKTEFFLPINEEDKKKNSAIFLLTPNLESSINMMKHPLALNRRLFESYYIEKDIAFILNESRQLVVGEDIIPVEYNPLNPMNSIKMHHKKYHKSIVKPVEMIKEGLVPKLTFYHGTSLKLNSLHPTSPMLGNKLEDAKWATYLWRDKTKARYFAIQKTCRNILRKEDKDKNYMKPAYDIASGKSFLLEKDWDCVKDMVVGNVAYVYTTEVPANKIGFGHCSSIAEFTTDIELPLLKTERIYITSAIFDEAFIKVGESELKDRTANVLNTASRGILKYIMHDQDEIFKKEMIIKKKLKNKEISPGDNLNIILDNLEEQAILSEAVEQIVVEDYDRPRGEYSINEDFVHTNYEHEEYKIFFGDAVQSILEDENPKSKLYSSAMRKLLYSERIKNQKECVLIHDKVKTDLTFIKYTYINYALYKQKNLFIDWSYYTQTFFKNNIYKMDRAVDLYFEFITRFLDDARLDDNGYVKKTVFVPVQDWIKTDIVAWDYTKDINPISVIYRLLKRKSTLLKEKWGGYNFVFLSNNAYFKLDFNDFDDKGLPLFTMLVSKLSTGQTQDAEFEKNDSPKAILHKIIDNIEDGGIEISNLTGGTSKLSPEDIKKKLDMGGSDNIADDKRPKEEVEDEKKAKLVTHIKDTAEKSTDEKNAMENLNSDIDSEWVKNLITDLQSEDGPNMNIARKARISSLRSDFANKKLNNTKIEDIIYQNKRMTELETDVIPIKNINEEWNDVKFTTFSKNYNLDSDIYAILADMGTKSDPIMVIDVDRVDTSTSEDYVETWSVKFEDANGKRFTTKLDIPKFVNNRFMKLRGNLKVVSGQLVLLPIIKTDEDTAQIVSSYNKIFVRRVNPSGGSKTTRSVSKLIKALSKYEGTKIKVFEGDNSFVCEKYDLPIEYRDLAGMYSKIVLSDGSYYCFNMDDIKTLPLEYPKEDSSRIPFYVNAKGKVETCADDPANIILDRLCFDDIEFAKIVEGIKPDKRLSYTTASILNTDIPIIVVMAYSEGLQTAMKKGNVTFQFTDKRPDSNTPSIKFSDGYITYDTSISSSLLMAGLLQCDTASYSIKDINKKEMWLDFLDNFGGRIKADGMDNFYDLMMDPMTKEICELYNLPSDYVEALGYASDLLVDTKFNRHVDITGNRIRTNEIVAGYVYKALSKSYGEYKNQLKRNKKDASLTIKQSAVIDAILTDPTSTDLSILNALLEVESANAMSFKGLSGMNSDRSYSLDKRTYDESMLGVLASSTGFAANVGITRQASINSNVKGNRGLISTPKTKDANTLNMLCATEALTPFGSTHDDPIRTAMAFVQTSKHQMRVKKSSPNLVTMGMDEALPYITSDTFSHKFKGKKGKVIEVTDDYLIFEETGDAVRSDGVTSRGYVDLRETVMKNSDGGFYVTVKLDPCVKKGDTLKYNDILAYDKTSYSKAIGTDKTEKIISYNIGTLAKLGILTTDEAYEDSAIIVDSLADSLTTTYCVKKERALSKDTNVYNVAKKGDTIEEGDPLIIFQNAFEEKDANALLKSITDDDVEAISDLGRIHVRSKLTGWVQDVKIYRTCELDELSPSLKKLVSFYEKQIQTNKKLFKDNKIEGANYLLEPDYKLPSTGKLKGVDTGVLIEFYIKCEDKMGIGDKLVYSSAIKGVVKDIIPIGEEPYTDFHKDEQVDALLTTLSINARMVGSIILNGSLNKVLVELDRQCKEKLGIPWKNLKDM